MIHIPDYIQKLRPYKPGNALKKPDFDIDKFVNIASNENPMGPSPKAIEALHEAAKYMSIYPDVGSTELIDYLAEIYNRKPEQIICGSGSDAIIADIIKAFSEFGDEIITGSGTFIGYFTSIQKYGRKLVTVPLKDDYSLDLEGMVNAITAKSKIIFIPNPNNPTGLMIQKPDLDKFISKVPENVLIVLDEAYIIFSQILYGYPNALDYNKSNIIVTRTLSKSHGLAGVRIGFAIGPEELIEALYKVKLPFEPNIIAQKIARAALEDHQFVFETIKLNTITLGMLKDFFEPNGIKYINPAGNFIMLPFESEQNAKEFTDECYKKGILVRHLTPFGLPNCVRISTGLINDTIKAIKVFEELLIKSKK